MAEQRLTLALAHYDRHVPFFEGDVGIQGVELCAMEVGQSVQGRDGQRRHERMLRDGEFEAAEVSLSSYLMAKDRGLPFSAIPVFPRRLFSLSQIWCYRDAGIRLPQDLAGKRVGLNTYQTTLSVLAKGDLQRSFGVPWKAVHWVLQNAEIFDFTTPPGVSLERVPAGKKLQDLLLAGEIDAVVLPHPPRAVLDSPEKVTRLFQDARGEELQYVRNHGYFPIMHVIAFREQVLRDSPALARATLTAFDEAWEVCRRRWDDPNWSWLAWGRHGFEEEREQLGRDVWANGFARNRANLEWFIEQSREQGLISKAIPVETLFDPSTLEA